MSQEKDLRVLKTNLALEKALFTLLEQKPFGQITVLDLCREAMIGKATFYDHYIDKYDLARHVGHQHLMSLRHLIAEEIDHLQNPGSAAPDFARELEHLRALDRIRSSELNFKVQAERSLTAFYTHRLADLPEGPAVAQLMTAVTLTMFEEYLKEGAAFDRPRFRAQLDGLRIALNRLVP